MEKLIDLIKAADDFYSMSGAAPDEIEQAEKELGLVFADDYKDYVMAFGAATFDSRELTGICKSERLCVVPATERARTFYPQFPENMYVIEEMQFDHILTLQDSTGKIFSYGPVTEAKQIAASLQEYLFPKSIEAEHDGETSSLNEN